MPAWHLSVDLCSSQESLTALRSFLVHISSWPARAFPKLSSAGSLLPPLTMIATSLLVSSIRRVRPLLLHGKCVPKGFFVLILPTLQKISPVLFLSLSPLQILASHAFLFLTFIILHLAFLFDSPAAPACSIYFISRRLSGSSSFFFLTSALPSFSDITYSSKAVW